MRYRHTSGIGPLKRTRWEDRPFNLKLKSGDEVSPVHDLTLQCVERPNGLSLQGTLRGRKCFFADLPSPSGGTFANFVMVSVSNVELRGRVEIVE